MNGLYMPNGQFVSFSDTKLDGKPFATRARVTGRPSMGDLLPNPDTVLRKMGKNIQIYRDLKADAHVGGCVRRRKAAVKALSWGIEIAGSSEAVVARIESIFNKLKIDRIISEILDAPFYGYQPLELMWDYVDGWYVPIDIVGKPAEWFAFDEDNILRFKSQISGSRGEILPNKKFIVATQDASYDNPYGVADLSRCFWPTAFKNGGMEFWVRFTEKYGSPFLIGKHPRSTPLAEKDELLNSLEAMVGDAIGVIPDDASIEILESGGKSSSADVYEKLLMFCRSEVSIALLGQNQTTEADANFASATAGALVTADIRDADKKLVEEALNQVITWVVEFNTDETAPKFSMWQKEEIDKSLAERDAILGAIPSGPYFTKEYWTRTYGFESDDLGERPDLSESTGAFPSFSEKRSSFGSDQVALDNVIDTLSPQLLQTQMENLLRPVLNAILKGKTESEVLGLLAEAYPQMDDSALIETLHRLMFASDVWGRLSMGRH